MTTSDELLERVQKRNRSLLVRIAEAVTDIRKQAQEQRGFEDLGDSDHFPEEDEEEQEKGKERP